MFEYFLMNVEKLPPPRKAAALAGTLAVLFAAVPAANAMVASVNGTETHNTDYSTASTGISEIWNRTVRLAGGTGTYLGKDGNGTHYILTANHVNVGSSASISATGDTSYTLTVNSSNSTQLAASDGTKADLKVVAVSGDAQTCAYLDTLGAIGILRDSMFFQDTTGLSRVRTAYVVGTGCSSDIGKSYSQGTRQKEWASFNPDYIVSDGNYYRKTWVSSPTGTTQCYAENFSNTGNSFQGCSNDSGSGVFVYANNEWLLAGTLIAVGMTVSGATTIGYAENASDSEPLVCHTYFADLSQYADQINAILAIPEPSAFGLFAGTLALAFAASRRRRSRKAA